MNVRITELKLLGHLHSLKNQPTHFVLISLYSTIPYVTINYKETKKRQRIHTPEYPMFHTYILVY